MLKIIRFKNYTLLVQAVIFCFLIITQVKSVSAQQFQYFGIPEYSSRSIGMGLTGIIDAYGSLSVLRNPALNRTEKRVMIKPFFQWIGNGKWDEVILIPQRVNDASGISFFETDPGLTSNYWGGVIQGRGVTLGYIHSNRKEFLYSDVGLIEQKFYGRQVESDFLFAGYNIKIGRRGRIGFLLKNIQFIDTGVRNTLPSNIVDRGEVDLFLDEKGSDKETTVGIDIGGLLAVSVLRKPVTIGFSLINVVSSEFMGKPVPFYLNAGIAVVPLRNLLIELNAVDIADEDGMFSDNGIRAGIEYTLRGLRIRSGLYGDTLSFGLGVGGEGLSIDYGVFEIDHMPVKGESSKEMFQSFQVSLSGNFY